MDMCNYCGINTRSFGSTPEHPGCDCWLMSYDWILINSSGGKDSQAMLDLLVERCDRIGKSRKYLVVVHADRELLDEYVRVETKIGHTLRKKLPIASIRDALDAGERSTQGGDDGCWNM
jgi:tRNA(Ile)-lysidine synthase TilS/MesJ